MLIDDDKFDIYNKKHINLIKYLLRCTNKKIKIMIYFYINFTDYLY